MTGGRGLADRRARPSARALQFMARREDRLHGRDQPTPVTSGPVPPRVSVATPSSIASPLARSDVAGDAYDVTVYCHQHRERPRKA